MADVVNPQVVDDVTSTNFKIQGGMPGLITNFLGINMASHNRAMDHAREMLTLGHMKGNIELDAEEAAAQSKVLSQDLPDMLARLQAAIVAMQQFAKVAQTTPPETGKTE